MSLVPIALIPQIMLAGALTPIKSHLIEFISYFTIARWGNEGFSNIQKEVVMTYAPPTIEGAEAHKVVSKDVIVDAIPELMKNSWFSMTKQLMNDVYADKIDGVKAAWISHQM